MQEPVVQAMSSPEPEPEPEPEYHVHQNYMAAFDGFFRPDEPLRRADCAQLLYNLTQDAPRSAEPAQYDDVLPEYWYYEAVSTMGGYLPQEEGQTCFFPSASVMPDTFLTALLSALGQTEQSASPALLQAAQALMPDGAQAEDVPAPAPITRAQAAVLVNRALGRKPDTEAINGVHRSLLLDVPEDRADYADLVEAVLPHDYYLDDADEQEHYRADALDALSFTLGIHLSGTSGFFVDADGRVVRGTGFLDEQNRRYYRCDESGRILADYAPHYIEGHAVFIRADGLLRRNGVFGEYLYDENGFYTTGNTELDAKLDDFIAADNFDTSSYLDSIMAQNGLSDGVMYQLPFYNYAMCLVYNEKMWSDPELTAAYKEKYGTDLTPIDVSVEEYLQEVEFISDYYGKDTLAGLVQQGGRGDPIAMEWLNWYFGMGGDWFDENGKSMLNSETAVKAAELVGA